MNNLNCTARKEAEDFVVEVKDHDTGELVKTLRRRTILQVVRLMEVVMQLDKDTFISIYNANKNQL